MSINLTKTEKSPYINPVDYFNITGSFISIFSEKHFHAISETQIALSTDPSSVAFELLPSGIIKSYIAYEEVVPGCELTKFMALTMVRFNGNVWFAYSHVAYSIMKNKVPFIRVGKDYFKVISKKDRFGGHLTELKPWSKDEIKEDHGKAILKLIRKFDDFTIEPNNMEYSEVIDSCFNLYSAFNHQVGTEEVTEGNIPVSIGIMKHIFGDQVNLGFQYMKLLFEHPKQMLPVLCLVSTERGTGKTTFLNWLTMIFGSNSVVINPKDLARDFNTIYATKNIVMMDEAIVDKVQSVEKLKSLATAKTISVSQKFISEYSIPFFGKLILCTNKESDFMRIDEQEIRFWIRKINPVKELNTFIENDLFKEIPLFLKYLTQLPAIDFSKSRMVFTDDQILTESLSAVKTESKSWLCKELIIMIDNHLNNNNLQEFLATPTDIKEKWFNHNNQVTIHYIGKVIKDELKLSPPEKTVRYHSFGEHNLNQKVGKPYAFTSIYTQVPEIEEYNPF